MAEKEPKGQPNGKIRVSLDLSQKMFEVLEQMEKDIDSTKSGVLRHALALMEEAIKASKNGHKLGIIDQNGEVVTEFIVI